MSVDYYRRQVGAHQQKLAKFQVDKARLAAKAGEAFRKMQAASSAAGKAKISSTIVSKLREAERYSSEYAKNQTELGKLEIKIADEQKRLITTQGQFDKAQAQEQKKQDADQKKREAEIKKSQTAQKRADLDHEHRMREVGAGLARHEVLHQQTARQMQKLRALPKRITVLFMASDPGVNKLALDLEVRTIGEKIRASEHRDAIDFQSRWAVRPGDILQAINELRPTVVHFSGHGTSADALVLQDDQGRPKHVPKEAIVSAIAFGSDSVKLVFFNTCFSFNQAQAAVQNVNAAIGMNQAIGDQAARIFSSEFYSGIGFGHSLEKAFRQAKAALMMEDAAQANIPELHLKAGVTEEEQTLVRPREI
ncbi:CHAT domain-containing protein [Pseudomonas sp. Irchel s3b2]|uniref:CHAT domain-containing protein n=1 Tax=Pseudomonas sp. Irchel s3b2 TaxID=2009073 RepID=UPI000BA38C7F|nr:CHAT domain-containing protein [Pseudomonas sp. Irchel s3b2]